MRKFYSRILAVCMAGTMAFTPFAPVGTLIGNNITIEAKAADAVDTSWYDNRTEGQTEFTITTAAQLRGLAELVNKNEDIFSECKIKLGKDIDLNNEQWTPIGNGYEFNGEFDGQGHTIYNLKESEIEDANYIKAGLFGVVKGISVEKEDGTYNITPAVIKNVTIENADIEVTNTKNNVPNTLGGTGALVSYGVNINIENCKVKNAKITANNSSPRAGAMLGNIEAGKITNCQVEKSEVNAGANDRVGLLCGYMQGASSSNKKKEQANAIQNVRVQGSVKGRNSIGGVIGYYKEQYNASESIFKGAVTQEGTIVEGVSAVAGIAGFSWNIIEESINNASVTGTTNVSGITSVSQTNKNGNINGGNVSNCINNGDVTGDSYVAGILACKTSYAAWTASAIDNCYNRGNIVSKDDNVDAIAKITGGSKYTGTTVSNSYNLGNVNSASGNIIFNESNKYTNVYFKTDSSEIVSPKGTIGQTEAQFKDRTVVDALNANDGVEETVWYQNTENPDLAFNMTVTSDITVPGTLNVTLGKTMKLQASITPEDPTNKTLVYTSSDDTIASVKEDGTVSGLKLGTADITVKAMDTGKEKNVKVTVKEAEKEPANPTNPAKPSQPTTKTVKKGTKLTVGTNIFVVTNVKAKTVSYKGTKKKKVAKITIPATVKSGNQVYKVTAIADNAFKNNKKIKTVVVGKNVRTIGKKAFYGCKNLKKITVQSSIIKKVGAKAFKGINKKAVIKVPSKKYKAYKKVFKGKGQVKTVTIKK